jgi:predicted GH43/DUF377 family glycosyl hydrolase
MNRNCLRLIALELNVLFLRSKRSGWRVGLLAGLTAASALAASSPDWGLGPFIRPEGINPVIRPSTNTVFACPMRGQPVRWEALHTFNPAAVVREGKVWLFYRAEDDTGEMHIGRHTSRLGVAVSSDGLHFERREAPAFFPAEDGQKENEWPGGCEDPRLVEAEDGTYVLTYTQWNRKVARLAVATSRDLVHWAKQGPAFGNRVGGCKSGAILTRVSEGRLKAAKLQGKYWMYWGEGTVSCGTSADLIHWEPGTPVLPTRTNRFDRGLAEGGPPALVTERGILVLYNGKNRLPGGDASLPPTAYSAGQALFDIDHPTRLLERTDEPFFKPEAAFERTGQYAGGTTFIEGLVFFKGKWFLYYGCADSLVAVAVCEPAKR